MNWHEEPEMPRAEEIIATQASVLPHHEVQKPPRNKNRYLEAQYRLLRHEGTELLRRSVQEFRQDPGMAESSDTAVYTNVVVHGYLVSRIGMLCRIGFCPSRTDKRIRWNQSPRLTPGTIVALSPADDKFQNICLIANVVQRDLVGRLEPDLAAGEHPSTPPRIDIAWADPKHDAILDPDTELVMVEARNGYYESVRHAMRGLQEWSQYPSRFERYLIDGAKEACAPQYLRDFNHTMDLSSILTDDTSTACTVNVVRDGMPAADLTSLDPSQLNSLQHVLTSELAIVQGPPGTGKTFTSVSALKVLLSNLDGKHPIVIAAQTNHALDQILLLCAQATKAEFVRLGRRSQNEFISARTVFNLKQRSQKSYAGKEFGRIESLRKTHAKELKDLIDECFPDGLLKPSELLANGVITQAQHDSLDPDLEDDPFLPWLNDSIEQRPPHRFEPVSDIFEDVDSDVHDARRRMVDDDEKDRLSGQYIPILESYTGRVDLEILKRKNQLRSRMGGVLRKYQDLWDVPRHFRGAVYRCLRDQYVELKTKHFRALLEENAQLAENGRSCRARVDAEVIKEFNIPIVGCTATGLTKYRKLIENLQPRVLLVEEAAETREANITSALFPSLEQVILVGDHMQLAPHTDLRELGDHPYNLRVSLFERMINLGAGHAILNVQRRMSPEIRLILEPFYPTLQDHESVLARTPAPGMCHASYFFCHKWPESQTQWKSSINLTEARMIAGFVRYLVQNGTDASKVTILTFYQGQRGVILRELSKDAVLNNLSPLRRYNVCTVDGYQGEENDVVILSLVRSPRNTAPYNVGFLDNQNRVVVALSRARRGFYIFGNYRNLVHSAKSKAVWGPPTLVLRDQDRCHSRLPLTCKRHGEVVEVRNPQDWEMLHGGCRRKCEARLECGHVCQLLCHPCAAECDYVPKAPSNVRVGHIGLYEFLGSENQTRDEAVPAAVGDAAQDLISMYGGDEVIPNDDAVASDVSSGGASPDTCNPPDASDGTGSRTSPKASQSDRGSVEEEDLLSAVNSPSAPNSHESSNVNGGGRLSASRGIERAGQHWSKWDLRDYDMKMRQELKQGPRVAGMIVKETFREVQVRDDCQRKVVKVHRSTNVHQTNPSPDMAVTSRPTPSPVRVPAVLSSAAKDNLIDFSDAPASGPIRPLAVEGPYASSGYGGMTLLEEEDVRSEVSDLIRL
ncbi:uncharacterized protein DNG_09981 [Cephalotrichum gorgonifer]|uniref:Uncharacterized protein n=1 Tax=Cephalotrichum gorgonifer TaxID=2041049 RepID=A0AAE8N8W4_9PEZI|nr:uncharacterized protein DNG_09981 [Cephalotrichum gorgonifer]